MLNQSGIKKVTATNVNQILFAVEPQVSVGAIMSATGTSADSEGKKIVKAGTPVAGDLTARGTAFTKATTTEGVSNAIGVLLHDVDVTAGNANATVLIFGFVNLNMLDATTAALITTEVKTALGAKVTFLK
jgi:hypothetical protein